jgi:hypothetical protein
MADSPPTVNMYYTGCMSPAKIYFSRIHLLSLPKQRNRASPHYSQHEFPPTIEEKEAEVQNLSAHVIRSRHFKEAQTQSGW